MDRAQFSNDWCPEALVSKIASRGRQEGAARRTFLWRARASLESLHSTSRSPPALKKPSKKS